MQISAQRFSAISGAKRQQFADGFTICDSASNPVSGKTSSPIALLADSELSNGEINSSPATDKQQNTASSEQSPAAQ